MNFTVNFMMVSNLSKKMAGRKPLPTAIKKMKGTLQKCRTNKSEPVSSCVTKLPPAPKYFTASAKKIYKTKGDELIAKKILDTLDFDMFISYCIEYANYIDTSIELAKIPNDAQLGPNSEAIFNRLKLKNKQSWERAKAIAVEFGFTPSSRSRVKIAEQKIEDPFGNFLNL